MSNKNFIEKENNLEENSSITKNITKTNSILLVPDEKVKEETNTSDNIDTTQLNKSDSNDTTFNKVDDLKNTPDTTNTKKSEKSDDVTNNSSTVKSEKVINKNPSDNKTFKPYEPPKNSKSNFQPLESSNKTKVKRIGPLSIIGIIILILVIIVAIAFSVFTIINSTNQSIAKGVFIKGIDVSGLNKNEAKQKIQQYISENLPENIQLKHNDYETSIPLSSLEVSFDIDSAINTALSVGKGGNFFEDGFELIGTLLKQFDIEPVLSINENHLITSLEDISSKLPDTVIESSYYIDGNNLIITSGKEGNIIDINQMTTYIKNGINNLTLKNRILDIATKTKSPESINIEKVYEEVHKDAKDAYYTPNPFAVYPSENGVDFAISLDEARNIIESESKDEYTIPLKVLYPSVTTNMIGTEAFPDLLSRYSTKYSARDVDRTTNLKLASDKINGTVIMPGETFSYNQVVGKRTIAAGYKEAPIYVQGKVVDGLGGGICQITSTLYNAVIYANLEIVERSNHQFVPSYVTASRDATVVYGSIDFKFKNNRDYPIKIVCSVANGVASFQIFGLKTDNDYEVEISSYVTGTTSNSIYSEAYKILKRNGQVVDRELLSRDTYKRH